jgi:hypothetical protein
MPISRHKHRVYKSHVSKPKKKSERRELSAVYNMDEIGVMPSMLGSVKVLVGKDDTRKYRGARVKRTIITAVECISADGRYLNPMIIWPATTHRSSMRVMNLDIPTPILACSGSSVYLIPRPRKVPGGDPSYWFSTALGHMRPLRS